MRDNTLQRLQEDPLEVMEVSRYTRLINRERKILLSMSRGEAHWLFAINFPLQRVSHRVLFVGDEEHIDLVSSVQHELSFKRRVSKI